jgi:molecular chaperone HtpG
LPEFKGKRLKAADKGEVEGTAVDDEKKKRFQSLLDHIKETLSEVKEAKLSNRLKESAVCLVSEDWAMGAHMERLMRRMGRGDEVPASKRILEVNPDHPAIEALMKLFEKDRADSRIAKYCQILYNEALLTEGSRVSQPAAFARLVNELLVKDATT